MGRMDGHDHDHDHDHSYSSSIDSNKSNGYDQHRGHDHHSHPLSSASCSSSSLSTNNNNTPNYTKDLSTDLRLGLSISSSSSPRGQYSDWPPIKPVLRSTLAGKWNSRPRADTLFVKVYKEGILIGRKLDLLAHDGYDCLVNTLAQMFNTTILFSGIIHHTSLDKHHILIYEDKEGDWMMVGDVPWEWIRKVLMASPLQGPNKN